MEENNIEVVTENPTKNSEGYSDPTPHDAFTNIDKEEKRKGHSEDARRFYKLLKTIFYICENAGFHVEGRITLRDKRTGKVWK